LAALLAAALMLAGLPGCSADGAGGSGNANGEASSASTASATGFDGALLPGNAAAHDFTLTDQYGRHVSLSEFRGRVVILTFLYTASKTTAPLIAQQIRGALDELEGQSIPALAVGVDPAGDTSSHVRRFLRAASLTGRMEYLTGSPSELRKVWHAYSAVPASAGAAAYERGAFVVLLDKAGVRRVEFALEELTPETLSHDIRGLLRE
jgi:cytochrome oxidase Cu insertion factor (SCO1/SenC/PrrC family)